LIFFFFARLLVRFIRLVISNLKCSIKNTERMTETLKILHEVLRYSSLGVLEKNQVRSLGEIIF
jgi:hypothetical protein